LPYNESGSQAGGGKKKKIMIGGGVGILVVVAIVLIVVFATKKSDDGGDQPEPTPPTPDGFNPYYMDPTNQTNTVDTQEGVLQFNKSQFATEKGVEFLRSPSASSVKDDAEVGVDTENVASSRGVNNDFIERVRYNFGQASYKRTVLSLTDDNNPERFDIPDDIVAKQTGQYQFRLDAVGFHFQPDPFTFQFKSTRTGETLIDTRGRTFIFQDKFIQIDMTIPTGRIYGFGERETSFDLGRGAWTMWPTDNKAEYDSGLGGKQLQGMHPFCLIKTKESDEFFGIFFRSSNAQSPIVQYRND